MATWEQEFAQALHIQSADDAEEFLDTLIVRRMALTGQTYDECDLLVRNDLGYWSGYYSEAQRAHIERLFHAVHPLLGPVSRQLTMREAMALGAQWASGDVPMYPQPPRARPADLPNRKITFDDE